MKKTWAFSILAIVFVFSSLKAEATFTCQQVFRKKSNKPYTFDEAIDLIDQLGFFRLELNRFGANWPEVKKQKELHPPTTNVRDRFFQKWGNQEISLPEVSIVRVSKKTVEEGFYLGELSNGQLVFVTKPLKKTVVGREKKAHYDELHLIEYELFRVGLTPFLALGKEVNGEFRLVRPIYKAHVEHLLDFNIQVFYKELLDSLARLEKVNLPILSQYFRPELVEPLRYYLGSALKLGSYRDRANNKVDISIVGLERAGLKSWIIDLAAWMKLPLPPRSRSAEDFVGTHHILRGVVFAEIPPKVRIQEVNKMYKAGQFYDALMTIYVDLLITGRGNSRKDWENSSFQARVDEEASITPQGWKSEKSLKSHFKSHGKKEMGLEKKEEYLEMAMDFFKSDDGPTIILKRQGTKGFFKYNFETREFGILDADLKIVTYYILDSSYRSPIEFQDYLAEQLGR